MDHKDSSLDIYAFLPLSVRTVYIGTDDRYLAFESTGYTCACVYRV